MARVFRVEKRNGFALTRIGVQYRVMLIEIDEIATLQEKACGRKSTKPGAQTDQTTHTAQPDLPDAICLLPGTDLPVDGEKLLCLR